MAVQDQTAVDVAIIGAGPAGLTAAYLLTKKGYSVTVIEKDERYVGGISRTVELDGFRFDIGGHRFFSKSQQVVDLWNEILPDDFIQRPRMSRIYYEGKFYSYPLRAFEALWNLGVWRSTLCMASFAKARLFPNRNVRSFQDWTVNAFGHKLFSIFFKTYTEKVWGMPCDEMSADWAAQRIKGLSLWGAVVDGLKRSLGLNKKPNDGMATKTLLETFRYPRLGPGMMWDAARDKIVASGKGEVLMGHGLKQLASDGQGGWRLTASHADGETSIRAKHAISSAPMRELAARLPTLKAVRLVDRLVLDGCAAAIDLDGARLLAFGQFALQRDRQQTVDQIGVVDDDIVGQLEAALETTFGDPLIEIVAPGVGLLVALHRQQIFLEAQLQLFLGKARHRHADAVVVVTQLLDVVGGITGIAIAGRRFDEIGQTIETDGRTIERRKVDRTHSITLL